jgi:hypothetical protein
MISDFTYAFLLENGSLIDFTEKLALCTRTSISIEFVGIFLVQVHRSGILAQQFDVDSMTALREYNWNSPAPVCAASIIGNSRLCVLAMQNGSLQLVKLCIEENGDTIEIKPLYSRPLRAEISCVKLSAVGNSIHCIVGTHEPSISLFRVMYDLDDVFVRLLDGIC